MVHCLGFASYINDSCFAGDSPQITSPVLRDAAPCSTRRQVNRCPRKDTWGLSVDASYHHESFRKKGRMLQQKPRGKVERGRRLLKSATENCVVFFFFGWAIFWSKFWKSRKSKQKGGRFKKASSNSKRSKKVGMHVYTIFLIRNMGSIVTADLILRRKCSLRTPPHHLVLPYVFLRKTFPQLFPTNPLPFVAQRGEFEDTENQQKISSRLGSVLGKAVRGGGVQLFLKFLLG